MPTYIWAAEVIWYKTQLTGCSYLVLQSRHVLGGLTSFSNAALVFNSQMLYVRCLPRSRGVPTSFYRLIMIFLTNRGTPQYYSLFNQIKSVAHSVNIATVVASPQQRALYDSTTTFWLNWDISIARVMAITGKRSDCSPWLTLILMRSLVEGLGTRSLDAPHHSHMSFARKLHWMKKNVLTCLLDKAVWLLRIYRILFINFNANFRSYVLYKFKNPIPHEI